MKKRNLLLTAIGALTLLLGSCSNEGSVQPENTQTASELAKPSTNSGADTYIQSFYNTKDYTYGKSIITKGENGIAITVDEVIVKSDARGYVLSDASTRSFLYFIDIDRTNYTMKTYDAPTKTSETIADINNHPDYSASNGFDLIKIGDDLNSGNLTTYIDIDGDKFWGPDKDRIDGPHSGIVPGSDPPRLGCWNQVRHTVRRFFIRFNSGDWFTQEINC